MDAAALWQQLKTAAYPDQVPVKNEEEMLEDALAFIGDFDFETDATANECDDLTRVLWDEIPEMIFSPPVAMAMAPSAYQASDHAVHAMLLKLAQPTTISSTAIKLPEAAASTAQRAPVVNKTRTRRREELIYLRGLVGDLEQRLTRLRSNPRPVTPESTGPVSEEATELVSAWEEIAARQSKQREAAEMENIKLRRLLEDQIQVGKSLERLLLKKRPGLEPVEGDAAFSKRLRRTNSRSWNRDLIFDELLVDCVAHYAETARVLVHFKHLSILNEYRDIGLVHDPVLGVTLQSKELRVLPFDYQDTASEIWTSFPSVSTVHHHHEYHDVDITSDTLKFQFRVTTEAAGSSGDFSVKMVSRRFVEANRTVIVMAGILEPNAISDVNMDGVRVRLTAWHVIEPICGEGSSDRAATKVIGHLLSVPEVEGDQRAYRVGTLTDFLLAAISVELESRTQHLENRLLQRTLNRSQLV